MSTLCSKGPASADDVANSDSIFLTQCEAWLEEFDSEYQISKLDRTENILQPQSPTDVLDDDLNGINIQELLRLCHPDDPSDYPESNSPSMFSFSHYNMDAQNILQFNTAYDGVVGSPEIDFPRSPDDINSYETDLAAGSFFDTHKAVNPMTSYCDESILSSFPDLMFEPQQTGILGSYVNHCVIKPQIAVESNEGLQNESKITKQFSKSKARAAVRSPVSKPREGRRAGCKNNTKAPNIAHWTAQQVCDASLDHVIAWKSKKEGTFVIRDQKRLAELWGKKKNKPMDFASYSRALRYHYTKSCHCELVPIPKKLIYKFSEDFMKKIGLNWMKS